MAAPIQKIARLAFKVFSRKQFDDTFHDGLKSLQIMINNITSKDLNFDINSIKSPNPTEGAPVAYLSIWEDRVMSIGVFVVNSNGRLPLHDHPGMHGIIRVIHGSLSLKSFTEIAEAIAPDLRVTQSPLEQVEDTLLKPTRMLGECVITTEDECCFLTPTEGNIHEIKPVGERAAFLDVLAPPYGSFIDCNYYRELSVTESGKQSDGVTWLSKISPPEDYWCESFNYSGPLIDSAQFNT